MMTLEEAKKYKAKMMRRAERLSHQIMGIGKPSGKSTHDIAIEHMRCLTECNVTLRDSGYRTTDEGVVVPITQEWIDAQRARDTKQYRLLRKARRTGKPEDIRKAIRFLATLDLKGKDL